MSLYAEEIIERTWNAPLSMVWEVLTSAEGIASWFGPKGFRADVQRLELVDGGAFDYTMTAVAERQVAWMQSQGRPTSWSVTSTVVEVLPERRFIYESRIPTGPGVPEAHMRHIFELEETDEGVRMVLAIQAVSADMIKGAAMGFRSSFERMARHLEALQAG